MNYTDGVSSNRSNKKQINRRDLLEIDNILVWEVSNDSNREYFVSLQGYSEETGMTRVMVSGGKRESTIIKKYQREGFDITCCSAACRMTVREEDAYKKDLNNEEFDSCIYRLFSLETRLNYIYGFRTNGKVKQKTIFR